MTDENPHLGRPRDLASTDVRFEMLMDGLLTGRNRRTYLMHERIEPARERRAFDDDENVSEPARRLVEFVLCTLCGGGALAAVWFTFFVY